jgi:hypothetical protein
MSVTAEIAVTLIVGQDHDHVRGARWCLRHHGAIGAGRDTD